MKDIPWYNRPYSKIRKEGISKLDTAELLAVIFEKGNYKHNSVELANKLLSQYNLHEFSNCSISELTEILGDEVRAFKILSLSELFKEYSKISKGGYSINKVEKPSDLFKMFVDELKSQKKEHLYAVLLDSKSNVISQHLISVGTLNSSLVHPREVFKNAIKNSAYAIALVHNHPGGNAIPSDEDIEVTRQIYNAGKLLGINLKYHVIVTEDDWYNIEIS